MLFSIIIIIEFRILFVLIKFHWRWKCYEFFFGDTKFEDSLKKLKRWAPNFVIFGGELLINFQKCVFPERRDDWCLSFFFNSLFLRRESTIALLTQGLKKKENLNFAHVFPRPLARYAKVYVPVFQEKCHRQLDTCVRAIFFLPPLVRFRSKLFFFFFYRNASLRARAWE